MNSERRLRKIICPQCGKKGKVTQKTVTAKEGKFKCPDCENFFLVHVNIADEDDKIENNDDILFPEFKSQVQQVD
jgi:transposase-like protein